MRYAVMLFAALACLAAAGCSFDTPPTPTPVPTATPTPTSRPTTGYESERLGLKAALPGADWQPVSGNVQTAGDSEDTVGEIITSSDLGRELLFAVWHVKNIPAPTSREMTNEEVLDLFETEFAADNFYEPPTVSSSTYNGFQARRVEGVQSKYLYPPNYHLVLYFFFPDETSVYMIGAGSRTTDWEKGGQEDAEAILASVELIGSR
jgi:hypothetical protein